MADINLSLFDLLDVIPVILQMQSLDELHQQTSTDEIQRHLQKQDHGYLSTILENQVKMMYKLDRLTPREG